MESLIHISHWPNVRLCSCAKYRFLCAYTNTPWEDVFYVQGDGPEYSRAEWYSVNRHALTTVWFITRVALRDSVTLASTVCDLVRRSAVFRSSKRSVWPSRISPTPSTERESWCSPRPSSGTSDASMTCLVRRVVIRELDLDACDLVVIKTDSAARVCYP